MPLTDYEAATGTYDEMFNAGMRARPGLGRLVDYLKNEDLTELRHDAELAIRTMGISFTVYSEGENIDRSWPFDIIPRTIMRSEWTGIAEGLEQRLRALNMFITDVYNDARIIKDKIVPSDLLKSSKNYRKECEGITPALGVWAHICGTDLIRDSDGTMYVLEDNLRVPSGVSYMLENRNISKRVLPELLRDYHVLPMDDYPMQLFDTLSSISPRPKDFPEVVVLTPGIYNSAYFEHAFLAQRMGAELVEGQDLVVGEDDCVYMKNVEGLSRVDVIYRRIDDLFIDPEAFHPDSVLGCRGLMRAWKKGNVALANAPGAGVADDKVVYNYVPDMIRYYLSEEPKLPNVPSFMCTDPKQLQHVLQNLESLVVKPANESGGYGLYIGPKATKRQTSEVKRLIKANPREFIAQPVINLSTVPTFCGNQIEPRHVDLRPFVLQGNKSYVTEGGLSRVALVKGSLVVNSSQGGGSKDTWIIDNRRDIAKGGE